MLKNIYILEDDITISLCLQIYLKSLNYNIVGTNTKAEDALKEIPKLNVDLIICDIILDGQMDGCTFSKKINLKYLIPIMIISAYHNEEMLKELYEAKIVYFLLKPYTNIELKISLELLQNQYKKSKNTTIYFDEYSYQLETKELQKDNISLKLSKNMSKLLYILIKNRNNVVSYMSIYKYIYGEDSQFEVNTLRQLVKRVKNKYKISLIKNIRGIGYKLHS